MGRKVWNMMLLHFLFFLYSLTGIFSKLAAQERFFSHAFLKFYINEFIILFFYAIGWQQVIKRIPLTTAFINKSITIVWGLVWGVALFGEKISIKKLVSIGFVIAGMMVYVKADETNYG